MHPTAAQKNLFAGVVLLAPMLSLEKVARSGLNRVLRPLGLLLNLVAPTLELVYSPTSPMFPDLQEKYDKGKDLVRAMAAWIWDILALDSILVQAVGRSREDQKKVIC
jgi:hypothetical protein